jgi:hypothetical protein
METTSVKVTTTRHVLVLICLLAIATGAHAQQQPSRLLVTNNTGTTVELFAAVKDTWQSRGRISPGSSMSVYNVTNGQRFRAVWGSKSTEHTIKLTYDRTYGGWQDVLILQ